MQRFATALLALALTLALTPCLAPRAAADGLPDAEMVKGLQIDLIAAGYLDGGADGIFGPATEAAIRTAQRALGLTEDGCMSDSLRAALLRDAFPLHRESRNSLVYEMQKPLYDWGFLEDAPTGYFGAATEDAVRTLQRLALADFAAWMQQRTDAELAAMDVPVDVVVDHPIYSTETVPCDGVMTEDWHRFLFEEYHFSWIMAAPGERSDGVKLIQKRLHALGYLYSGLDGTFGGGTERALKYFQRRNGLPETGSCDTATSDVLFSADATVSDEYVMPYMAYVRRSESRIYIFGWDGAGYNEKVRWFKCSCGKPSTPTLEGTYYCEGPVAEWYYMEHSHVWVRYAYKIKGNYFFHSVLFRHKGDRNPTDSQYDLGRNVSNGCIRMAVDDIQWLYENCPKGLKVIIE